MADAFELRYGEGRSRTFGNDIGFEISPETWHAGSPSGSDAAGGHSGRVEARSQSSTALLSEDEALWVVDKVDHVLVASTVRSATPTET